MLNGENKVGSWGGSGGEGAGKCGERLKTGLRGEFQAEGTSARLVRLCTLCGREQEARCGGGGGTPSAARANLRVQGQAFIMDSTHVSERFWHQTFLFWSGGKRIGINNWVLTILPLTLNT